MQSKCAEEGENEDDYDHEYNYSDGSNARSAILEPVP